MSDIPLKPDDLPSSWAFTTLGAVVDYGRTTKAEPSQIAGDDWVLELEDIEKGSSRLLQRITFARRKSKSTKSRFQAGDVLYGKLRPYLNKVLIADQAGYCTTEIVPIESGPQLDNRYLFYWLKHPAFLKYVEAEGHGMNMPRLGTETAKAAPFALAPRNEQTRIADQLDKLLARIQACNDRLDAIPALLKRFRQAVLTAATSGALTEDWRAQRAARVARMEPSAESGNCVRDSGQLSYQVTPTPDSATLHPGYGAEYQIAEPPDKAEELPGGWYWIAVGELATKVVDGVHKKPNYVGAGIPFLTVRNMTAGPGLDFSNTSFVTKADHEEFCKRTHPERDDILISKDGTLGVVRLIDTDQAFSIFVSIALIKLRDKRMSRYMRIALESPVLQKQMVGVGSGLQHIHLRDLRQDVVPVPPLDEQAEIVRRVETLFQLADRIEARYTAARAQARRLTSLLLAKAFRGELVTQDPDDEPAAALLERLRAQRLADPRPAGRGRKTNKV